MSAIDDSAVPIIKVLYAVHPSVNALDVLGSYEVLTQALHNPNDPKTKAFEVVFASSEPEVEISKVCTLTAQASFDEAQKRLAEFDVLVVPGGNPLEIIKAKAQPLQLIKAFSDIQMKNPTKERTILSIGTGSLLLAHMGLLAGLSATTHPDYFVKFENLISQVTARDLSERTDVMEERYVVNNLRFDLGENPDENPYIRRKSDARRPSNARKGSNAWKESNTRRESNARRATMRLGGLRVITAGGPSCAIDAALYLVSIMVAEESAQEVVKVMQHVWTKGVVVDGIDI